MPDHPSPTPEGRRCPRAKSDMTPCVVKDGVLAVADDGNCVGCGEFVQPCPSPEGGEANPNRCPECGGWKPGPRLVAHSSNGARRCGNSFHSHEDAPASPTPAATGGEEGLSPETLSEMHRAFLDLLKRRDIVSIGTQPEYATEMFHVVTAPLRRQLAEAGEGVARQDRKWMDAIRRIAGREICFSPGWAGHDHTKVPHPTLEQFVNELRERATTAERRLEEMTELHRVASTDGKVFERALTASQQEVARLREALDAASAMATEVCRSRAASIRGRDPGTANEAEKCALAIEARFAALSTPQQGKEPA